MLLFASIFARIQWLFHINICCGGIKEKYLMLSKSIQSFISEIWCLCKIIWYFFISTGHHHHSQSHYYYHPIKWCQAHVSYGQKIFGWNVIFYNLVGFCVDVYVVNNSSTKFLSAAWIRYFLSPTRVEQSLSYHSPSAVWWLKM